MNPVTLSEASVNFSSLSDQVCEILREQILSGNLEQGRRLSINALARQLGVSGSPVRDALKQLSSDGLVQMVPRRGTFVSKLDERTLREAFESRTIVECAGVERLPQASDELVARMESLVERNRAMFQEGTFDYARHLELDEEFHECIVGLMDNQLLEQFWRQLRWPLQVFRVLSRLDRGVSEETAREAMSEHTAIVQAFKDRNVGKARDAVCQHLETAQANLRRGLKRRERSLPSQESD